MKTEADKQRDMKAAISKASGLVEALSYIQSFRDKIVVVKMGGSVLASGADHSIGVDVTFMEHVGMRPVIVHGGGPHISDLMKKRNKEPKWIDGLRVTDAETLDIVQDALSATNDEIVDTILSAGGRAIGLTLEDRLPLRAEKLPPTAGGDLGYVGNVAGVEMGSIVRECLMNRIPVIMPIARAANGDLLNVNADAAAGAVAAALGAEKLVNLSDTHGVRLSEDADDYAASLSAAEARSLMKQGVIQGGMIPKVLSCITALEGGVRKTHIIDGRMRHSLLLEIYTDKGVGTEIVP